MCQSDDCVLIIDESCSKVNGNCWLTLVNIAQGRAEIKLIIQINRIIFRASPIVERAIGDSGLHMAMYLK